MEPTGGRSVQVILPSAAVTWCPSSQANGEPLDGQASTHHCGQVHILHPPVLQQHGLEACHPELHRRRAVHEAQQPVSPAGRNRHCQPEPRQVGPQLTNWAQWDTV